MNIILDDWQISNEAEQEPRQMLMADIEFWFCKWNFMPGASAKLFFAIKMSWGFRYQRCQPSEFCPVPTNQGMKFNSQTVYIMFHFPGKDKPHICSSSVIVTCSGWRSWRFSRLHLLGKLNFRLPKMSRKASTESPHPEEFFSPHFSN